MENVNKNSNEEIHNPIDESQNVPTGEQITTSSDNKRIETREDKLKFKCQIKDCLQRFRTKTLFTEHTRKEHGENILSVEDNVILFKINHLKRYNILQRKCLKELIQIDKNKQPAEYDHKYQMMIRIGELIDEFCFKSGKKLTKIYKNYYLRTS